MERGSMGTILSLSLFLFIFLPTGGRNGDAEEED
jgi:hypothetical protein